MTTEIFDELGVAQVIRIVTFSNFYNFAYKLNSIGTLTKRDKKGNY